MQIDRDIVFDKLCESSEVMRLRYKGPKNVDQLISTLLSNSWGFFLLYTGASRFKVINDILEPHKKQLLEKAYLEIADKQYGDTIYNLAQGRKFFAMDKFLISLQDLGCEPEKIKSLIGEDLYSEIKSIITDEDVENWYQVTTPSALIGAMIQATSNCNCK